MCADGKQSLHQIPNHNAWLYASYTYQQEREWKALRERLRVLVLSGAVTRKRWLQRDGRTPVYGVREFIRELKEII